jgi:hypothetical protein
MRYVYQGVKPIAAFEHCNDVQAAFELGCARYDLPKQNVAALILQYDDYSKLTPEALATLGKDYEGLLPVNALEALLPLAEQGSPLAIARLLLAAPSLSSAAVKHLAFDSTVTPEQRAALLAAMRRRIDFIIAKGGGLVPLQVQWLSWYVKYAENPTFNLKNKMEFMKILNELGGSGYQAPHHKHSGT